MTPTIYILAIYFHLSKMYISHIVIALNLGSILTVDVIIYLIVFPS